MSGKIKETLKFKRNKPNKILGIIGASLVVAIGVYCSFALSSCESNTQVSSDISDLTSLVKDQINNATGNTSSESSESVSDADISENDINALSSDSDNSSSGNTANYSDNDSNNTASNTITVHICGSVMNPGVYELHEGDRIIQGIEAAGGFVPDADQNFLNLAKTLSDGDRVYIPTVTEVEEGYADSVSGISSSNSENGLININTAGVQELTTLPGIGEIKAQSIVDYRNKNGNFSTVEEIKQVEGIKDGVYEQIAGKIRI